MRSLAHQSVVLSFVGAFLILAYCTSLAKGQGFRKSPVEIEDKITNPLRHVENLPETHRWDDVNGKNYLTLVRNDHAPEYCGGCWAQAAASSISDRIKILTNGTMTDVNISPQLFLICSDNDSGCNGGDPISAFKYGYDNYLTDETCTLYQARGRETDLQCAPTTKCKSCYGGTPGYIPEKYRIYKITEYGKISGEMNMMQEIYQRGPIVCNIAVTPQLQNYTEGIFEDLTQATEVTHSVSVVGYGIENSTKYWLVRNSWGSYWGEEGYFRIVRGNNNLMIESDGSFAVPHNPVDEELWHETTIEEKEDPSNDYSNGPYFLNGVDPLYAKSTDLGGVNIPDNLLSYNSESLPTNIDWRNVDGVNYLSWTKNQHTPTYGGCCWAQASSSALSARFNILSWKVNGNIKAKQVALSPQVLISGHMGGTCWGGNSIAVYQKLRHTGLPDESCSPYTAQNKAVFDIPDGDLLDFCKSGSDPTSLNANGAGDNCKAVTNYTRYYVKGYNFFANADNIKKELVLFGPISGGMKVTPQFKNYTTGIYEEEAFLPIQNHLVTIVGYGLDEASGLEYWIVQNSWGTYWGENGFFRIRMHKNNLGIESYCSAGYPSYEKVESEARYTNENKVPIYIK